MGCFSFSKTVTGNFEEKICNTFIMKRSYSTIILLSSALALLVSSCGNEKNKESNGEEIKSEQKGREVSPEVIFENDYAKVLKVSLAPGDYQPLHEGENRVIYSLTDYAIDWEEQGENSGSKSWKKGDVHFHEGGKHAARNSGTTTAEWLVFAKKNTVSPECGENKTEDDVKTVSTDFARVLLENDEFKIIEVNLPIGAEIPMHSGINRIIYSLSEYQIDYESDSEGKKEMHFNSGDIHWHEACQHSLKNIGETEAEFLVVSFKQKDN